MRLAIILATLASLWIAAPADAQPGELRTLQPDRLPGMCLTMASPAAEAVSLPCTGRAAEKFLMPGTEGGPIQFADSCLVPRGEGYYPALVAAACDGSPAQTWKMGEIGELRSGEGRCISLLGAASRTGGVIFAGECPTQGEGHAWRVRYVDFTNVIEASLESLARPGQCIGYETGLALYPCSDAYRQVMSFDEKALGQIRMMSSCLSGGFAFGTLRLGDCWDMPEQKWVLLQDGRIANQKVSCIEVANEEGRDTLRTRSCTSAPEQKWRVRRPPEATPPAIVAPLAESAPAETLPEPTIAPPVAAPAEQVVTTAAAEPAAAPPLEVPAEPVVTTTTAEPVAAPAETPVEPVVATAVIEPTVAPPVELPAEPVVTPAAAEPAAAPPLEFPAEPVVTTTAAEPTVAPPAETPTESVVTIAATEPVAAPPLELPAEPVVTPAAAEPIAAAPAAPAAPAPQLSAIRVATTLQHEQLPGMCMSLSGRDGETESRPCDGSAIQDFQMPGTEPGPIRNGERCLVPRGKGMYPQLVAEPCNASSGQTWMVTPLGELRNVAGRCLSLLGTSSRNGERIYAGECPAGLPAHRWRVVPVDPAIARPANGMLEAVSRPGKCLGTDGSLGLVACDARLGRIFSFDLGSPSQFRMMSSCIASGFTVETVALGQCWDMPAQKWALTPEGTLANLEGKCIAIVNEAGRDLLRMTACLPAPEQQWTVKQVKQ